MAKPSVQKKGLLQNPVAWFGIAAVLGAAYLFGGPEAAVTKKVTKPKTAAKKDQDDFLPADYSAKFETVAYAAKNSFHPLVAKGGLGNAMIGGIPSLLAMGEANWAYTGLVEVDGKPQALLENLTTGDSVYLSIGEKWKSARVKRISVDSVVLTADGGDETMVPIVDPSTMKTTKGGVPSLPGTLAPAKVAGLDGMPVAQGPIANLDVNANADVSANGGNGNNRGNRGRGGNRRSRRGSSTSGNGGGQDGSF